MTGLVVRKMSFEFDATVQFMWRPTNPSFCVFCNVFTFIAGPFEKYIMGAMRKAKDRLAEDPSVVLQSELEGTGVRASVLRPGPTQTSHATAGIPMRWHRCSRSGTTGGSCGTGARTAEDIAAAIATVISAPDHVHLRLVDVAPTVPRAGEAAA